VNRVPDYVFFDHSFHVATGVGCSTCHGPVQKMPLMRTQDPLTMGWCLQCHLHPERYVRPKDRVFDMAWQPPGDQQAE
jgi:Cytochrome c7 and related cytochrome c